MLRLHKYRVHSKLKGQNSRTFQGLPKDLKLQFQVPKVSIDISYSRFDHNHITFKTVLKNVHKQIICTTHWDVFLLNYNQVVVKCQILEECFLQNFNMQNFQNMYHSNSRTFQGPTLFSRTYKGLEFFSKIQGLSRTYQGPYEPRK